MIVVEVDSKLHLVTQGDHAHLSADILASIPALADEPRRDVLLRATRRHDDGWQGIDAAPPVDAAGRPHDFLSLPWNLRAEVWDRGTSLPGLDPGAALLIAEHALFLHRDRSAADDDARDLVELLEGRRDELREQLGPTDGEEISSLYPWLRAMDLLSLVVVNRWAHRAFELELPGSRKGTAILDPVAGTLSLDPFPLAGTTTLHYSERTIDNRPFRDALDLGTELALARWESASITLKSGA